MNGTAGRQVIDRGWSPARRAFRQHYDTDVLDSSLLRMSTVGFITPTDPMWLSTLQAMGTELVTDSLMYRYDPSASPDGLRGSEGPFSLCTFAYVTSLALAGEQIGSFPQAFTHLSLIDAATTLDRFLDRSPAADESR